MGRAARLTWLLALVSLVGLAGCNAVAPEPGTTVTPAPVPDNPESPGDVGPGVSSNVTTTGIDGQYVARVHTRTLQNTSYTVNQSVVQRFPNGTVAARYVTRGWFGPDGDLAAVTLRQFDRGSGGDTLRVVERFQEGDRRYRLVTENGTRETTVSDEPGYGAADYRRVLANGGAVARVFAFVSTDVVDTETVDGTEFVTVETTDPESVPPLENVTLTARISERNVIDSYRVAYEVERQGQRLNTTVSLVYTDVGTTTVERPAWVDNATARAAG